MADTLQLGDADGRTSYFLDGQALRPGDAIELQLGDGQWLAGVYEWSGNPSRWPGLRFALGGDAPAYASHTAVVAIPPDALLRRQVATASGDRSARAADARASNTPSR